VHLAKSQEVNRRVEAVACKFDLTLDGGTPGLLLDPSCKGLRRGFNQTFHWRRIAGTNDRGSIAKTFDGHVHEALQYGAMEAGSDGARVRRDEKRRARQAAREKASTAKRYNPLKRRA
jgi:hypothetical protein